MVPRAHRALNPLLHAVIETNPTRWPSPGVGTATAAVGPAGRVARHPGDVKDNIATADRMQTTAGSLALVGAGCPGTHRSSSGSAPPEP